MKEKGIELLASLIGDGVQFFETVATKSNENNKKIDQHFQDGLDWLTGKNQDNNLDNQGSSSSYCSSSHSAMSAASTKYSTSGSTTPSDSISSEFYTAPISTLTETTVDETNEFKAIEFKNFLKNSINNYIEPLPWYKKTAFQLSSLVQSINDPEDEFITNTVADYLNKVNNPREKLTPEEYKELLFTIINKSDDSIAIHFQDTIVTSVLNTKQEII